LKTQDMYEETNLGKYLAMVKDSGIILVLIGTAF